MGLSETLARIAIDCRNINADYDYWDVITKNGGGNKRGDAVYWFKYVWEQIPQDYLYEIYKDMFGNVECGNYYKDFFDKSLLEQIATVNKHDTVYNPALISLLDEKGFLTVYHGHSKPTMRYSNSWTLKKDVAMWFGKRNSGFHQSPDFYCVTGKVKLDDVIAFVTDRNEDEIVVLQRYVKNKEKEFYKSADFEMEAYYVIREVAV